MRAVATLTIEPLAGALRFRLDVPERDAEEPLQREFRQPVEEAVLRRLEAGAADLLRAGARPRFPDDARVCGTTLYRTLVPPGLRAELRALRAPLVIATSLAAMPWELLHDEEEFWGLRYAMGKRLVLERPIAAREPARRRDRPRALVIGADVRGDLPYVAREIDAVADALEARADVVCVTDRLATLERVLALLGEGFDVVHFCGHVVADEAGEGALLLAGGERLPARVVEANLVGRPLVFLNGCTTAGRRERTATSVADAFLHGGAVAVVGTVADVADEHAATLAATFYREALAGAPLGHALREARAHVRETAPASTAWLSFVLHGNPAQAMPRSEAAKVVPLRPPPASEVTLPVPGRPPRRWPWIVALVIALVALAASVEWRRRSAAPRVVAVGVMEVRARGAHTPDWLRTLTRDRLNTVLSRVPAVQVFSRQKIDFLREKRGLTEIEAAETLGMTKLLGATVDLDAGEVTLEAEVVDIASGVLENTTRVHGPEARLLDLETELALRVLTALGVRPTPEELAAILEERRDATVEAYRLLTETLGRTPAKDAAPAPPASTTTVPPLAPDRTSRGLVAAAYAQAPDDQEKAIRDLLRRYGEALESKRVDALATLQVAMDDAQRASLDRYFAIARDLRVRIADVDVLVEGGEAVATFTREDSFTDAPSGRTMRLHVRVSGRLVREGGTWKIKSLGDGS